MRSKNAVLSSKLLSIAAECAKYLIVGGIAFCFDTGTLYLSKEYLLPDTFPLKLYTSVTLGFAVGFLVNYVLSFLFVFTSQAERKKAVSSVTLLGFLFVGLIGLCLNWAGMYVGVTLLNLYYIFVKVVIAAVVVVWNYFGRKLFLYFFRHW